MYILKLMVHSIQSMRKLISVSYTHLDVYKRQHLNLTKAQLKGATLAIVPGDPARSERIAKKLDNPEFLASTRAVSYTHLDVYKRQA